jgi:hypothetical protein
MNVDLGELMRQRSVNAETTMRTDRVDEVRRRISRVRRRRTVSAVVAGAAVLAAVATGATLLPPRPTSDPEPVATMRTIDGFPEYAAGARVIGTAVSALPDTQVSVTVVPETLDLVFTARCDPPLWIEIRAAGHEVSFSCNESSGSFWRPRNTVDLAASGLEPGQPATFVATVTGAFDPDSSREQPLPDQGTFAFAVMSRVAFDDYPFPPRPSTLASLDDQIPAEAAFQLRSDPADPTRPVSRTLAWSAELELEVFSTTPGFVTVSINGTPIVTQENWSFGIAGTTVGLAAEGLPQFAEGTPVTVTADPLHVTGPWAIWSTFAQPESTTRS